MAAFDWLVMDWVLLVLEKKGVTRQNISRIKNLYTNNTTICVANNKLCRSFKNICMSLRQGDIPSMNWFAYGIDPLISYLDKRLSGITIFSLPVAGPAREKDTRPPPISQSYKVIGYADDIKPGISSMQEFILVDNAAKMFEGASGCKLHRDPTVGKCKFLPLGRWKGTLEQEDIPCNYMQISDHLDMVGVVLKTTHTQTRKTNGDEIQSRVKNTINPWLAGKFMPLTQRPWSVNCYSLSKVWFRCHSLDLRILDTVSINSKIKSWIYADLLVKPEEKILFRPANCGGLGLLNVNIRAQACLIKTFLETAANQKYLQNLYHVSLFRYHILNDRSLPNPGLPPYYNDSFFSTIRRIHNETPMNIINMSLKQWYQILLEDNVITRETDDKRELIPGRAKLSTPSQIGR